MPTLQDTHPLRTPVGTAVSPLLQDRGRLASEVTVLRQAAPAAPRLDWLVIRDDTALTHLRAEWSRLADRCEGGLFQTPEWIECWRTTIALDVRPRVVTGWDEGGRLRVVWPLGVRRCGGRMWEWLSLEPMGAAVASGDRLGPLCDAANCEADLLAELRGLARHEADVLRLHEIPADSPIVAAARREPWRGAPRLHDRRVLPMARLPADWESYACTLGPKLAGHVRRQERAALARQGMVWRLNDEAGSLDGAIDGFMQVHQCCWRHRGMSGNFARDGLTAFVRAFAHVAHRRGWLRLHRLCQGERTAAALLALHHAGRAYYYQSGWDPRFTSLSPGSLCIARAIRAAIDERMSVFDFLRGDEAYKRRWATQSEETLTLAVPATRKGRLVLAGHDAKRGIKRIVVRCVGQRGWDAIKRRTQGDAHT